MTPLRLTTWFRKRMLPLVAASATVVAAAAPIAFHVQKRHELLSSARGEAGRVAEVVRIAVEERPRLWRYDAIKLGERLAAEGLDRLPFRIYAGGAEVGVERIHPAPVPKVPLWGRYDLVPSSDERGDAPAQPAASVWVAVDASPLYTGTAILAALFALLAVVLGTVLYLLPVYAIAGAERRIHLLLGQLALTLQEEDRRRIARDLHDGAGQAITAARLELLALAGAQPQPGAASDAIRRIASHLDDALGEVRRSTAALAPPALAELGFARAVSRHCEAFADAVGLKVICELPADLPALGAEAELACYRVVQEALTNVARHAAATRAWVRLAADPARRRVRLEIEDDGAGLAEGAVDGRGLAGIRERAALLGGEVELSRRPGGGLRLAVTLPSLEEGRAAPAALTQR